MGSVGWPQPWRFLNSRFRPMAWERRFKIFSGGARGLPQPGKHPAVPPATWHRYVVAEVLARYFPADVPLVAFGTYGSLERRKSNWLLLQKLFQVRKRMRSACARWQRPARTLPCPASPRPVLLRPTCLPAPHRTAERGDPGNCQAGAERAGRGGGCGSAATGPVA